MRWVVLLLLPVSGCGGSAPNPATPPADETLQREVDAGRLAYAMERNEEAAAQYRAALTRAQSRDDLDAIGDTGYDLAVAELRANEPARALVDARATRAEASRTGTSRRKAISCAAPGRGNGTLPDRRGGRSRPDGAAGAAR